MSAEAKKLWVCAAVDWKDPSDTYFTGAGVSKEAALTAMYAECLEWLQNHKGDAGEDGKPTLEDAKSNIEDQMNVVAFEVTVPEGGA